MATDTKPFELEKQTFLEWPLHWGQTPDFKTFLDIGLFWTLLAWDLAEGPQNGAQRDPSRGPKGPQAGGPKGPHPTKGVRPVTS